MTNMEARKEIDRLLENRLVHYGCGGVGEPFISYCGTRLNANTYFVTLIKDKNEITCARCLDEMMLKSVINFDEYAWLLQWGRE